MIVGIFQSLGFWAWLILGALLLGVEIFAPGSFILWLGIAAVAMGLLSAVVEMSWQTQGLVFAVLAVAAVTGWWLRGRDPRPGRPSVLVGRAQRYVGQSVTLDEPVIDGHGRVRVEDTVWRIAGPDLPAGTVVRVVRADGPVLVVEPAT